MVAYEGEDLKERSEMIWKDEQVLKEALAVRKLDCSLLHMEYTEARDRVQKKVQSHSEYARNFDRILAKECLRELYWSINAEK